MRASPAQASVVRRPVVLFLAGIGRSGSTLVGDAIGAVPGALCVGELHNIWRRGAIEDWTCSDGERFSESPFWQSVLQDFRRHRDEADVRVLDDRVAQVRRRRHFIALSRGSSVRDDERAYVADFCALYAAIGRVSGANLIVDTGKLAYHAFLMARNAVDIDFRVLHLYRDPRAVAFSRMRGKRLTGSPEAGAEMTRSYPAFTALRWAVQNAHLLRVRGLTRYAELEYGAFTRSPRNELLRLVDDLALDIDVPSDYLQAGSFERCGGVAFSGNPARFERRVSIVEDRAWQTLMPRGARWIVSVLTAPVRAFFRSDD